MIFEPGFLARDKGSTISMPGVTMASKFGLWPDFHKNWTVVRTKFIDDHIARIVRENEMEIESKTKELTKNAKIIP